MRVASLLFLIALLAGSVHQRLSAQQLEQSIYVTGGIGAGSTSLHCDICASERKLGLSIALGAGARIGDRLALGLEVGGWRKSEEEVTRPMRTYLAVARWYPAPSKARYFLKTAVGMASYQVDDRVVEDEEEAEPIGSKMFAAELGIGYQLRLSGAISINPQLTLLGSLNGDLERGNTRITSASVTMIQLGVTVGWR